MQRVHFWYVTSSVLHWENAYLPFRKKISETLSFFSWHGKCFWIAELSNIVWARSLRILPAKHSDCISKLLVFVIKNISSHMVSDFPLWDKIVWKCLQACFGFVCLGNGQSFSYRSAIGRWGKHLYYNCLFSRQQILRGGIMCDVYITHCRIPFIRLFHGIVMIEKATFLAY